MRDDEYYRILLDEDWRLTDLYEFPHAYSQNYAFVYCLDSDRDPRDRQRIDYALENYPWRGGYSYVNIYTVLQNQIPRRDRPSIKSISKSSPGWLDLFLNVDVAIQVAKSVAILAGSAATAVYAYKNIQKYLGDINIDRRRHQLQEMQITQAQAKIFTSMSLEMAKYLGFKNLKELHERTGSPEITLKLLLAHYRRILKLVEYGNKGKAKLPSQRGAGKSDANDIDEVPF
jgi:hypothetical protein